MPHGGTAGEAREELLRDFLRTHLPPVSHSTSGIVIDPHGKVSKQQDLLVVRSTLPRFPVSSRSELVLVDGVLAACEVKSRLTIEGLRSACTCVASIPALRQAAHREKVENPHHGWPTGRPLLAVISYEGIGLGTIKRTLEELHARDRPDLVLVLSKGGVVRGDGTLLGDDGATELVCEPDPARAFMYFLTFLVEITASSSVRSTDWREYWP